MDLISSRIANGEDLEALREKHTKGASSPAQKAKSETAWRPPKGSHSKLKAIGKLISEEGSRVAKEAVSLSFLLSSFRCDLIVSLQMSSKPLTVASHPLFSGAMAILQPEANAELHSQCNILFMSASTDVPILHSLRRAASVLSWTDHSHNEASNIHSIPVVTIEGRDRRG